MNTMTLTEVSVGIKKYSPFAILGILILLVVFYAFKLFFLYLSLNKPVKVYINPVFGKITKPVIPDASPSAKYIFTLDNIEGRPITASSSAQVFYLIKNDVKFGYREKVYLMAKTIGFDTDTAQYSVSGTNALFQNEKETLTIDITNFNFSYSYNLEQYPEILAEAINPQKNESETRAIDFLKSIGRYPDDLAKGKVNSIFFSYDPIYKKMTQLKDSVGANLIEVDFYRPDINESPVVSPKFFTSQNYVLLSTSETGIRVIRAQIQMFERITDKVGAYPLIAGDEAYVRLTNNDFYLINPSSNTGNIKIKEMKLGYFDPSVYQEYMQPVYFFLGEGDFVGYVSAVRPDYVAE